MESKFKEVEKWLVYYYRNEFKIMIENRTSFLKNPPSMVEELGVKVTTGFNIESPQEKELTRSGFSKLLNDHILSKIERMQRTIDLFLEGCNQWEQKLLRFKYKENKAWDYIVDQLPFSRRKLFEMRNDLIYRLGRHLSWVK